MGRFAWLLSASSAFINVATGPAAAAGAASRGGAGDALTALVLFGAAVLLLVPLACVPLVTAIVSAYRGSGTGDRPAPA